MTENMLKYQCTACGGPLHFDTEMQMLVCDYCETAFPEDHFQSATELSPETSAHSQKHDTITLASEYICTSCGAEVVSDENTVATECMYCGNPIVLTDNVSGMIKPDLILPFKLDKEEAKKMLKNFCRKKLLLPSTFSSENRIDKIVGMYVPFWLYSGKCSGYMQFDAQTEKKHTSGQYEITTTKHYDAKRAGSLIFDKVPVDASKKMEDNYMDGLEPYDYNAMVDFAPTYMAGFFADKYDVDALECESRANERAINSTREAFKDTVKGYHFVIESEAHTNISFIKEKAQYTLLPVWVLNTKYKGKMYHFAINGQTGKVSGDLPIDNMKKRLLELALSVPFYIPLALFCYWLMS